MKKDKRDLLIAMSVAGAAGIGWKKPVVHNVVLSAHAATSCELSAGCHLLFVGENQYVSWPGGSGPVLHPDFYTSSNCTTGLISNSSFAYVVAASLQQAQTAFAIASFGTNAFPTSAQPPEIFPCVIYRSDTVL